jgi:hypothetical protein
MSTTDRVLLALIRERLDLDELPLSKLTPKKRVKNILKFKERVAYLIFTLPDPESLFKGVTVGGKR